MDPEIISQIVTGTAALLGGLGGATIAGYFGIKAVREEREATAKAESEIWQRTQDAEHARWQRTQDDEHAKWHRGERQRIYLGFLAAVQNTMRHAMDVNYAKPRVWNQDLARASWALTGDANQYLDQMQLLDPALVHLADDVMTRLNTLVLFAEDYPGPLTSELEKKFTVALGEVRQSCTEFTVSGRAELGVPHDGKSLATKVKEYNEAIENLMSHVARTDAEGRGAEG